MMVRFFYFWVVVFCSVPIQAQDGTISSEAFWNDIENANLESKWSAALDKSAGEAKSAVPTHAFKTDGTGKSSGLKIHLEYPTTWNASEGTRPHILQKFQSKDLTLAVTIGVKELPDELEKQIPDGSAEGALALAIGAKVPSSMSIIDYGKYEIAGQDAGWVEFSMKMERLGQVVETHGVMFAFKRSGKSVIVTVDSAKSADGRSAKENFAANSNTFWQVLNSFDFFDRYD